MFFPRSDSVVITGIGKTTVTIMRISMCSIAKMKDITWKSSDIYKWPYSTRKFSFLLKWEFENKIMHNNQLRHRLSRRRKCISVEFPVCSNARHVIGPRVRNSTSRENITSAESTSCWTITNCDTPLPLKMMTALLRLATRLGVYGIKR